MATGSASLCSPWCPASAWRAAARRRVARALARLLRSLRCHAGEGERLWRRPSVGSECAAALGKAGGVW
eukprot:3372186-Pyramimonas_sp.AAC.1